MRHNRISEGESEGGQALILFALLSIAVLILVMLVVDVGFYMQERQKTQNAADAAALAGAQELPGSPEAAEAVALAYVEQNGISPDDVTITFSCTSDSQSICQDGDGRYDTIRVTPTGVAPSFFGGVLALTGADSCWIDGCDVQAHAAGCRGACGPIGTGPADIMVVMDHSRSMSDGDIANAKSAIAEMFTDFDKTYQKVGVSLTPPVNVSPGNTCDTVNSWNDAKNWMPSGLTTSFQTSPHVLNTGSGPAYQVSCADRADWSSPGELTDYPMCTCHTDVGTPIMTAANELSTNGRLTDDGGSPVTWGLIVVTDGASNVAPLTTSTETTTTNHDTGWNPCSSQVAVTASGNGDRNGYQSGASNTCSNGGGNGTDTDSGNGTSTSCSSSNKDRHTFYSFGLSSEITGTSVAINGLEVRVDAWASAATRQLCIDYTNNGSAGSPTWTSMGTVTLTGSEATYTVGNTTNLTGLGKVANDFNNTNFRVRLTMVSNPNTVDFYLDKVEARVHYTDTTTTITNAFQAGVLGPCHWAMQQATAAKAMDVEVFIIGFGVKVDEQCNDFAELPSSPYYNTYADDLLEMLATDEDHYYNEPKSGDLEPIFNAIGSQLTGGSRLVE